MKKLMLCLLLAWNVFNVYAQKEGNIWYFGANAGLDFNVTPPAALSGGALNTQEGCASIANPTTGALLFYTDGITVWDRMHNPMPGSVATPLRGDPSSTQSGVIVPKPGSTNLYYVFTTAAQAGGGGMLPVMCYTTVDMTLNGGNGDVVSVNNVLIDSTTEKIAVVGNCDHSVYWIVGHRWNCDSFYAFKLTAAGLSAPVKSKVGIVHTGTTFGNEAIGYMKFSPNGKKLGLVTYIELNTVELFDFDFNTGVISNPITDVMPYNPMLGSDGLYGCSFSPGNSKFYTTFFSAQSRVYQYDLTAGSPAAILASRTEVSNAPMNTFFGALQNGPDGKMYVAKMTVPSLDVITNPDAAGAACGYVTNGLSIAPNINTLGLPDIVESFLAPGSGSPFHLPTTTAICKGDTVFSPVQDTPNHFVIVPSNKVSVNADSTVFAFFPSETTTYTITSAGTDCGAGETVSFTITVSAGPKADFTFDPATPSLEDATILLRNKSIDADSYAWYNSSDQFLSSAVHYSLPNPGEGDFCYTLVAKDVVGCKDTVEKCVAVTKKGMIFIPNTFSPNGDGRNEFFGIYGVSITLDNFSVFNRFGQRVFYTTDLLKGWDGSYHSEPCDVGTYYYVVNYRLKGEKITKKGDVMLIR